MQIDPQQQPAATSYKLLTNLIVPRPIAWVTSVGPENNLNLAPFSFFNALSAEPVILGFSVGRHEDGRPRDTAVNIRQRGEFVVHLVTEDFMPAMNISAADFPPEMSEAEICGLPTLPSQRVAVPRLADVLVSMECRLHSHQALGPNTLILGEVLLFHVTDALLGERMHIKDWNPVGRMGSPATYCHTQDRFEWPRLSYADWLEQKNTD